MNRFDHNKPNLLSYIQFTSAVDLDRNAANVGFPRLE